LARPTDEVAAADPANENTEEAMWTTTRLPTFRSLALGQEKLAVPLPLVLTEDGFDIARDEAAAHRPL
jgi:hypothetical protein